MPDLSRLQTADPVILTDGSKSITIGQQTSANSLPVVIASDNTLNTKTQYKATYAACKQGLSPASLATDIFAITGSSSKTIRIRAIYFSANATPAIDTSVQLIKRSTANSAGISVVTVPLDSNDLPATATVSSYSSNPTLGVTVGVIASQRMNFPIPSSVVGSLVFNFENNSYYKEITLNGTSQVLAVNLNGVTVGGNIDIYIIWTEE